jgi:hypothetical protein
LEKQNELEQHNLELKKAKQKADEERDFIKSHRHTIRNYGFEDHLGNLYRKLKMANFDLKNGDTLAASEQLNTIMRPENWTSS